MADTDVKLPSSGNIRIWWGPTNSFANWRSPSAQEINAMLDISDAISWNDFDFGVQPSTTNSDPAITAKGAVQTLGADQYGGGLSFYYPGVFGDDSNLYSLVEEVLGQPDTTGYIVMRIDGEELYTDEGTAENPGVLAAPNDLVHVFKVTTGGYADAITGEEAFRYTPSFLSQGQVEVYTVVRDGATPPTVEITPTTGSIGVDEVIVLNATVNTRDYTRGVKWTSSDPAIATVSSNGVVTGHAAGTANITCTFPETGTAATAPAVITVA